MTIEEVQLLVSPWLVLAAIYCWDYGMELLVPTAAGQ